MDFQNASLPAMEPLRRSFAASQIEAELKALTIDLFTQHLAADTFDASVLGAAHLGSTALVSRAISADGLAFPVDGGAENPAVRYLYRAWKGRGRGRGLHFLRTYLAMLFPGAGEVRQLWQKKTAAYPTDLSHEPADDRWLTSRVEIWIDAQEASPALVKKVSGSIRAVIPARIVPIISVVTSLHISRSVGMVITATRAMSVSATVR